MSEVSAIGRYARWIVHHRRAVVVVMAVLTLALAIGATRLRVEVNPDAQLPQGHPYVQALNRVHEVFGDKNLVVVGLFPHDGNVFTPRFLAKLAEITERLQKVPGANRTLIQSLATAQVSAITPTADGIAVQRVMEKPPVDDAGAAGVRERAFATDAWVGTLVSADGSAAAVHATFELTPTTPGYRNLDLAIRTALAGAEDGTYDTALAGPVILLSQLSAYASRMAIFFPIALVVIAAAHYDAFRTLQAMFLPLLTAILSVVWALGLMGYLGVSLDPFNTTTPILILAVAAGHAVQILKRFYEEYDRCGDAHEAVVASLERVGPVMLAAGAVAALSFMSLVTFPTASIRTFGLFTGLGIVSAVVNELTFIPAMRAMLPAPRRREREREAGAHPLFDRVIGAATTGARERSGTVLVVALLAILACLALARRVEVNTSLKREFSPSDPVRVDDARLNDRFAGSNTVVLLVDGDGGHSLEEPAILNAIDGLERRMEREPSVGKAISYVDFIHRLHAAMTGDRPNAGPLPRTRALTAQYLFLYSMSGGGAADFDSILTPDHQTAKIRILVHDDATREGVRLLSLARDEIARTFPPGYRVEYTGTLASTAATTETMVQGKLENIVQIAAITIVISALLLRSLIGGLLVALPLALAVAVNFGVMGLLGIPLDTMTSAISAMAVGIGADYAMYLLFRVREELAATPALADALPRALATSGKAVLFVSSAIACGYATLCLSRFGLHVQLGMLVALAMVVSSAGALFLLPAIVARYRPRFLWPALRGPALETTTQASEGTRPAAPTLAPPR